MISAQAAEKVAQINALHQRAELALAENRPHDAAMLLDNARQPAHQASAERIAGGAAGATVGSVIAAGLVGGATGPVGSLTAGGVITLGGAIGGASGSFLAGHAVPGAVEP